MINRNMGHLLLLLTVVCVVSQLDAAAPTGCTYDSTVNMYTCNARGWVLPLAYSQFTTAMPQRILIQDLTGTLASDTFSGFSSINTAAFDSMYIPSLYIRCFSNSELIIDGAAFTDFSYVDEVKIMDCDILSLPANVFSSFGQVNSFHIIGGSISNMNADAFKGLNVTKMTQYNNALGEFGIINSQLVGGSIAFGALYSMSSVERVRIENAHLFVTQVDMFYALKNMKYLSLSSNLFTKLNNNMFANLDALATIDIYNIKWYCTCGYLWFLDYTKKNNITLNGDIVCNEPAAVNNKRAATYYKVNCVEYNVCAGQIGFAIGGKCMTLVNMLIYGFTLITSIVACVAFGMTIHSYRKVKAMQGYNENRYPPLGRKISGATWNKVGDDEPVKERTQQRINNQKPERDGWSLEPQDYGRRKSEVPKYNSRRIKEASQDSNSWDTKVPRAHDKERYELPQDSARQRSEASQETGRWRGEAPQDSGRWRSESPKTKDRWRTESPQRKNRWRSESPQERDRWRDDAPRRQSGRYFKNALDALNF